jgi:hypothetical protein
MKIGMAFPVLPGKEGLAKKGTEMTRGRMADYVESRTRAGLTLERVWLQSNPDGSTLTVVYLEGAGTPQATLGALLGSGLDFDRWFFELQQEISGIDFLGGGLPADSLPQQIGSYAQPGAGRKPGRAFVVPIVPGATEAGLAFSKEAYETRSSELAASRKATGTTREEVFLLHTPMGDMVVVYVESDDLDAANQAFAASQAPFDRWFKDSLKGIFPPFVDLDQPVPANVQIWDWQA